jgi:hypothetical protein
MWNRLKIDRFFFWFFFLKTANCRFSEFRIFINQELGWFFEIHFFLRPVTSNSLKNQRTAQHWFFPVAIKLFTKTSDCPCFSVFYTGCLGLPHFSFLSLSSLFFDWMGLWNLRGALSKSKLPPKLFVEYMEIKLKGFFKFDGFYVLVLWVMWIWRHPNGMEVHLWKFMKSQDEIMSSKILFIFLYMKCSIFTVLFFALKVSRFHVLNA